jgi:hypothetical protein
LDRHHAVEARILEDSAMRSLVIATTIAALSLGSVAFAQSGGDSRRDEPAMNNTSREAPVAHPSHRVVSHSTSTHRVQATRSEQQRVSHAKPIHVATRYSAARRSSPDDFSANQLNHEELMRHTDDRDGSQR